jgi:predicted small lipoprotein YifL
MDFLTQALASVTACGSKAREFPPARKMSLRETKWLRGEAEANPEIPRFARNRLRNLHEIVIALTFRDAPASIISGRTAIRPEER